MNPNAPRALWLLGVTACWTSASAPPPEAPTPQLVTTRAERPRCPPDRVSGELFDSVNDEPMIGATVVLTRSDGEEDDESVTITDDSGEFSLRRKQGMDRITVYYSDNVFEGDIPAQPCKLVARLAPRSGGYVRQKLTFEKAKK